MRNICYLVKVTSEKKVFVTEMIFKMKASFEKQQQQQLDHQVNDFSVDRESPSRIKKKKSECI